MSRVKRHSTQLYLNWLSQDEKYVIVDSAAAHTGFLPDLIIVVEIRRNFRRRQICPYHLIFDGP